MNEPPRSRATRSLDRRVLARAFGFLGPLQAGLALALIPLGATLFRDWHPGRPLPADRFSVSLLSTLIFASIVLMQLVNAFECRSTPRSVFRLPFFSNHLLPGSVAIALGLLLAAIYVPGLKSGLGQTPLHLPEWLIAGSTALIFLGAEELRKAVVRFHHR